ncbi:MAG TPA: formylglycine-generating enzyme family protein [Armatimonadetes bacterium]|nr:formylglycine-generating enzyme family protein [Armatimonadota bacterium]
MPREVPPGSAALEFGLQVGLPRDEPLILEVKDRLGRSFQGRIEIQTRTFITIERDVGIKMVLVPAGTFIMGTSGHRRPKSEHPAHEVYLDEYYIDLHEVTVGEFKRVMGKTNWWPQVQFNPYPYEFCNKDDRLPVAGVTWNDVQVYVRFYHKKGIPLRLPTEAEWEKAARGMQEWKYPWGNEFDPEAANWNIGGQRSTKAKDWVKYLMPVGSFPRGKSPYGCLDMVGNVEEWCADWYDKNYYQHSPLRNPEGPPEGTLRVVRGGSWASTRRSDLTVTARRGRGPENPWNTVGFRCCVSAKDLPRDVLRSLQRRR